MVRSSKLTSRLAHTTSLSSPQTSIAVKFQPASANDAYTLQWKRHEQSWESGAQSKELNAGATKAEAEDLEPGTTYCIRLAKGGEAGPELILDTEQVGCTPTPNKGCCIVS